MKRTSKSCVLMFLVGVALLAVGTALAGSGVHSLSIHVSTTLRGGNTYCYNGICEPTDWCSNAPCPRVGPSSCDLYNALSPQTAADAYCDEEDPEYEDWICQLKDPEKCNEQWSCEYGQSGCAKKDKISDITGNTWCWAHPK